MTESTYLNTLEYLDVQQNQIGNIGAKIIAASQFRRLKTLNIRHNGIGDAGYKCFAESENLPLLESLFIFPGNKASLESKSLLQRSKLLRSINTIT